MIISPTLTIKETLTKFKIEKIRYEPLAESYWWLQCNNFGTFLCIEQGFDTLESDEQLVGQEIEAQIDLSSCEVLPTVREERAMSVEGNVITATGIYEDNFRYDEQSEMSYYIIIDSLFKIKVAINMKFRPLKIEKRDWITVRGEAFLILPRGRNIE